MWRMVAVGVDAKLTDWARLYQELLGELARLVSDSEVSNEAMREQLLSLIQAHRARRPRSRAEIVRARLIAGVRPVRALLKALARLPWQAAPAHPLLEALGVLRGLYERDILGVDAQVRFRWIMLGGELRSASELLTVYAGILAHGTALSAAETARMIPQLSSASVRAAMKWAGDERRLAQACSAIRSAPPGGERISLPRT